MRVVIQRVSEASVTIDRQVHGQIGIGLMVLVGIEDADTIEDIQWLSNKIINLRIFNGSLSAKTSFMAACILPSVALSGKMPCSFASSFTLSMVLANLRS